MPVTSYSTVQRLGCPLFLPYEPWPLPTTQELFHRTSSTQKLALPLLACVCFHVPKVLPQTPSGNGIGQKKQPLLVTSGSPPVRSIDRSPSPLRTVLEAHGRWSVTLMVVNGIVEGNLTEKRRPPTKHAKRGQNPTVWNGEAIKRGGS